MRSAAGNIGVFLPRIRRSWSVFAARKSSVTDATTYVALTFGALLLMVAALYLPNLSKLKVPGIELEKASVDRFSAPSTLDISRVDFDISTAQSTFSESR